MADVVHEIQYLPQFTGDGHAHDPGSAESDASRATTVVHSGGFDSRKSAL
jgi:hypothetical protein